MTKTIPLPKSSGDYSAAWIIAATTAIVYAFWIVVLKDSASPSALLSLPIWVGVVMVISYECWAAGLFQRREKHLVVMEKEQGLRAYTEMLALDVRASKKSKQQMLLFPGFEEPSSQNSLRLLKDAGGRDIPSISCERFSALLVTHLMFNLDKATEKGLGTSLARFEKMGGDAKAVRLFLEDKTIREIIKADIRGNVLTQISKGGEKVIKDLLKTIEEASLKRGDQESTVASDELILKS